MTPTEIVGWSIIILSIGIPGIYGVYRLVQYFREMREDERAVEQTTARRPRGIMPKGWHDSDAASKRHKPGGNGIKLPNLPKLKIAIGIVVFIVAIVVVWESIVIVPAGHRGVVLVYGAVQEDVILGEGMHFLTPFVQSVVLMNVQVQKFEAPYNAATHELQDVVTTVAVNYALDPQVVDDVYQDYGENYLEKVVRPAVETSVKNSTPRFVASELVNNRAQAESIIIDDVRVRLAPSKFILVSQVFVTNFEFSPQFHDQLNQKAVAAEQFNTEVNRLKTAEVIANQTVVTAQANANAEIAKAQGRVTQAELDAKARIALAQGDAEAIRLLNLQLQNSPEYLQLQAIKQWNGVMPVFFGGDQLPVPFLNMDDIAPKPE